jgi:predicted amidohydrolase YtcJ
MTTGADLILENANIITCDPANPQAEALAIKGEGILTVGNHREIGQYRRSQTKTIDCRGKTLVPGFIDAHCHFFSFARKLFSLDLSPAAVHSIEDLKESIRRKARFTPEGTWINGTDYNEFYLAEKRHPTRLDLDAAAPRHPVIITHRSLHASVLNSLALQITGITNETEEPPGGMIDRDLETGEPNGILYEMGDYVLVRIPFRPSGAEREWGISQANEQYLAAGITSLGEATVTNDLQQWEDFRNLKKAGKIKSRIQMMAGREFLGDFRAAGLITGYGDNNLKIGSLKIVLSETTGQLRPAQEELNRIVLEASRAGFQIAIHAVERDSVEAAIIALEYAQSRQLLTGRRPRIEHCSECPPDLQQRLSRLKAVVVSQPPFLYYSGERYLAQVAPAAQKWLYPFKSLMDSGIVVAGSSDSPVVPLHPLTGIQAAVTRRAESGQTVLGSEGITPGQAMDMYTLNAANVAFEEKIKGTLSPGKLADIVMLSGDPLESPSGEIKEIRVEMTLIGGEVVWEQANRAI